MGKIKAWYRSIPLWLAIFLLAAVALIVASFLSNKVIHAVNWANIQLQMKYSFPIDYEYVDDGSGQDKNHHIYVIDGINIRELMSSDRYSDNDRRMYNLYQFLLQYASLFIYSLTLLGATLLFYFSKLKKPLALLQNASSKIAKNEFDFALEYSGYDEMAKLCGAFEKMRFALDENNLRMHKMIEERKQLNDAYTHDLRTPLAVLKGYAGILTRFLPTGQLPPEKVMATVNTMSAHIDRLEQFVDSMNTAQKLADLTIQRESISTDDFVGGMRETAALLCEKRKLICEIEPRIERESLNIDPSAVMQVFENLLSNAIRFARLKIVVELETAGDFLSIRITDDGKGFSQKELSGAAKPYFSGEQTEESHHFGLGLYICHTLCDKHGGSLKLENTKVGGACVTASFSF